MDSYCRCYSNFWNRRNPRTHAARAFSEPRLYFLEGLFYGYGSSGS